MSLAARNNNDPPRLVLAGNKRAGETPDAISAWLDLFVRLLRFPEAERAGVREELESHLRERVRDLVLTDVSEVEAQRRAIAELGDAAELAQRYVAAKRTPTRRLVMNGLVAVAAGAALITSLVAVNHAPPPGSRSVEYQPPLAAVAGDSGSNKVAAHNFDKVPLREVFAAVAADLGRPLTLNEAALGQVNIDMAAPVTLRLEAGDLNSALKRINSALADHQGMLDWRVTAAQLEVATREHFDRMETKLISLELGNYFSLPQSTPQAVVQLVSEMVEPDGWMENGGNTSRMSVVGQKLFVKAPPRVVAQVAWIVERLNDVGDQPAAFRADRDVQASIRRRQVDEDRARIDEAAARKHKDDAEAAGRDFRADLEAKRKAEAEAGARADENAALERKRRDEAAAAARPGDIRGRGSDTAPAGGAPGGGGSPMPKQNDPQGLPGSGGPMPRQNSLPGMPSDNALAPLPRGGKGSSSAAPAGAMPGMTGGATAAPATRAGGRGLSGSGSAPRPAAGNPPAAGASAMPAGAPPADPRSGNTNTGGAAPALPAGGSGGGSNPNGNPPGANPPASGPSSEPSGLIYLEGKVDRPGVYNLPTNSELTLKRLLTACGGINDSASSIKVIRGVSKDAKVLFEATPTQLREVNSVDPTLTRDDRVQVE